MSLSVVHGFTARTRWPLAWYLAASGSSSTTRCWRWSCPCTCHRSWRRPPRTARSYPGKCSQAPTGPGAGGSLYQVLNIKPSESLQIGKILVSNLLLSGRSDAFVFLFWPPLSCRALNQSRSLLAISLSSRSLQPGNKEQQHKAWRVTEHHVRASSQIIPIPKR